MYFLGSIDVPSGETRSNHNTSTPFVLAPYTKIAVEPSAEGLMMEMGSEAGWQTDTARAATVPSAGIAFVTLQITAYYSVISVVNAGPQSASLRVWGLL